MYYKEYLDMPRNFHGGSKAKKASNKANDSQNTAKKEVAKKSNDGTTVYAKIVKKLGCGFVDVFTEEKKAMRCSIRGKFMKKSKSWAPDDVVIVDKMTCSTNESKGMIVYHLSKDQIQILIDEGDISRNSFTRPDEKLKGNHSSYEFDVGDDDFEFDAGDGDDENSKEKDNYSDDDLLINPNRPYLYEKGKKNKHFSLYVRYCFYDVFCSSSSPSPLRRRKRAP